MELPSLAEQIAQQDVWEWTGLITGILYVVFASKQKSVCWIFGIISSLCIAWKSYSEYHLIADVVLQIFYVLIGVYGLYELIAGQKNHHPKPVITTPMLRHIIWIWICLLISIPVSWWLVRHAGARYG